MTLDINIKVRFRFRRVKYHAREGHTIEQKKKYETNNSLKMELILIYF